MQSPRGSPGCLDQVCGVMIAGLMVIVQQEIAQLLDWVALEC